MEAPDPNTFVLNHQGANPSILGALAQGWRYFAKARDGGKRDMKKDVVGTGPFKLKQYIRGTSYEVVSEPGLFHQRTALSRWHQGVRHCPTYRPT